MGVRVMITGRRRVVLAWGPNRARLLLLVVTTAVSLVASMLLVVSAFPTPAVAEARVSSFPDVSTALPAHDAIAFLTGVGAISGFKDGTFAPAGTLTRGQATKVLTLWKGVSLVAAGSSFTDLDAVYRSYVQTACAQGWIAGFPDGTFRPYALLTRQQMATSMVRAMGWEAEARDLSTLEINATLSVFSDQRAIATVARPYVALAVSRGLFGGTSDGCLHPMDGITRAQFSLVVFRAELSTAVVIQQVRYARDYPDKTRVVIDLSRAPGKVTAALSAAGPLNVDYTGGVIARTLTQPVGSLEIKSVGARQLTYDPRTVRITLDLARYRSFRVMSLAPSEGKGYRIVVDAYRRSDGPLGDGPPLICVDAGHGGDDPGAIGVTGTKEKDINLAIALLLAQNLRDVGLGVMMTREDDSLPSLQQRADLANAVPASLFVSVHNNAAGDTSSNGTETFYWGTPDNFSAEGKLLAETIQRNLLAAVGSVDRGARTHWINLAVLARTDMTAVLTEVGFLTNAAEEARLLTAVYQTAAAQGIARGVLEYLGWSTTVYSTE
jgi:N-acetylmuramoyl-L-alanine amidase